MGADTPLDDSCTHLHLLLLWLEPHWLLCDVALRPCRRHPAYSEDVQVHERLHTEGQAFQGFVAEWTCVALLEILLVLQCYWFYLLCRAIHRMLILGAVEDVRSDSEDEPENTNGKKHE